MRTKFAAIIAVTALALAFISPTLLNSFSSDAKGWKVNLLNPGNPMDVAILVSYAIMITAIALVTAKLSNTGIGKLSTFLGGTIAGAALLGATFVGTLFFLEFGKEYSAKTFGEAWNFWMSHEFQSFVITNLALAIGAGILGLTFGRKFLAAGTTAPPGSIGTITTRDPDAGVPDDPTERGTRALFEEETATV